MDPRRKNAPAGPVKASEDPASPGKPAANLLFLGIGFKIASALFFTMMGACVKLAIGPPGASGYPTGQIVFFRSAFALVPVMLWLGAMRQLSLAFKTGDPAGQVRRGIIGSVGMFFGFTGLTLLPLPDATAISYAAPLISVVLAATVLGETVRLYRWSAVMVGFCGVIVMLWPHLSFGAAAAAGPASAAGAQGALFCLIGAICAAFAMIEVRRLTASDHTAVIVVYFSLLTTFCGFASFFAGLFEPAWAWQMPSLREGVLLALVGILGGLGQITLTQSFRFAPASVVAPFDYTSMIWALAIGYFLFGDVPEPLILIGAAIVIGAGIFVILRERQLGIERRRQRKATPSRMV